MSGNNLVMTVAHEIESAIRPLIMDARQIPDLSAVTADKGGGHTAHELDRRAEDVLFRILRRVGYSGKVYSEESGLVRLGAEPRLIVCDPYCNTTLTFRGIRESAIAVYEYTLAGQFVAGAIADLQVPRIVWSDSNPGAFVTILRCRGDARLDDLGATKHIHCSEVSSVSSAFLAISMMKRNRREDLPFGLLNDAAMVTTIDGAIVAARLALGEIDGFVDARIGQPSYEALAYVLVTKAGGVVSDTSGAPVDFGSIAIALAEGEVTRHAMVAACNRPLLADILTRISGG
jgi:fructose-1,6-bisphosphatase/inositol monophosphatase family enzyme